MLWYMRLKIINRVSVNTMIRQRVPLIDNSITKHIPPYTILWKLTVQVTSHVSQNNLLKLELLIDTAIFLAYLGGEFSVFAVPYALSLLYSYQIWHNSACEGNFLGVSCSPQQTRNSQLQSAGSPQIYTRISLKLFINVFGYPADKHTCK